jgi:hypothetical protein
MNTPLSKIIKKLENNQHREIKNVAQTMAIAADLVEKQQLIIETLSDLITEDSPDHKLLKPISITQKDCLKRFGSFDHTYKFYKDNYGITCRRSWTHLLPLIQNLPVPEENKSIEERLTRLEQAVSQIIAYLNIKLP